MAGPRPQLDDAVKEFTRRFACFFWLVVASACASTGGVNDDAPPEPVEHIGPLDGVNYVMFYSDDSGLRRRDTQAAEDTLLIPGAVVQDVHVAPDGSASAALRNPRRVRPTSRPTR